MLNRFNRINQHNDIQRQIIPHPKQTTDLHRQNRHHTHPNRNSRREQIAQAHHKNIAAGVEDAVAGVAKGDGDGAVAVDDERGVFEEFPGGLDGEGDEEGAFIRNLSAECGIFTAESRRAGRSFGRESSSG
jgi:hypothetical protein